MSSDKEKKILEEATELLIVDQFAKMIAELFLMFEDFTDETKHKLLTIMLGFVIFSQAKDREEIKHLGKGNSKESQEFVSKILQFVNSELSK